MSEPKDGKPQDGVQDGAKGVHRRAFLGATAGAAASAVTGGAPAHARQDPAEHEPPAVPAPTPAQLERDAGDARPPVSMRAAVRPGSDLMVEVLRDLGIEYVASNPGSSFEGLQESIINHGEPPNSMPEFITALHEESAVDMASGYARAEGRPMATLLHGTLGLQHATMAIYQAYHYQTPMLVMAGRDDGFIQAHTADDMAGIVRAITKWDAHPATLPDALTALQEAYRQAITPPCGPTVVILDTELQKEEAGDLAVPAYAPPRIAGVSADQAGAIAERLLAARNPRIAVGRLRTPEGVAQAVLLAELVGASTSTRAAFGPMSFPQRHALCGPGADGESDYELGLEAPGAQVSIIGPHIRTLAERDTTRIGYGGIREGGAPNPFAPAYETGPDDVMADAEASLALIIAAVEHGLTDDARAAAAARTQRHAEANRAARVAGLETALAEKARGWNVSPVSTARIYAELWPLIQDKDWCLACPAAFTGNHHADLWDNDRPYSYLGPQGAGGIGYGLGASVGAGLAAKERGRIVINVQADGDINFAPGSLWTAAHHRVPMLTVMHNNRAWHQELMFIQYMAGVRGRGADRAEIGTTLRDPFIDYAKMAAAYGMASEGPISDPDELAPALARGVESVMRGEPYLVDVICQPR